MQRPIMHEYGEPFDFQIRSYSPEEIIAEKLRAILQYIERFKQRGWTRSRARDYYDVWRILKAYGDAVDLRSFAALLHEKCAVRGVAYRNAEDFFQEPMIGYVEKTWEQWLGPLVSELPPFDSVMRELKPMIVDLTAPKP